MGTSRSELSYYGCAVVNKRTSLLSLDWLNFFMADVETGIGPFVATYLSAAHHFNPAQIGMVLGAQNLAEVVAQAPAGWLNDRIRGKRWLLAGAALVISIGALFVVAAASVSAQMVNQIAIGLAAACVSPTVNAISLGLVDRQAFAPRVGRNSAFSHAGNVTTALLAGYLGYAAGQQWIFFGCAMLGAVVLALVFRIRGQDIDHDAARGLPPAHGEASGRVQSPLEIFRTTEIALFALMVVVFHFANSAMLPLAGQELAKLKPGASSIYMSGCIVVAQTVMVPVAYSVGRFANRIGRKPIFVAAFAVLALRGLLFALLDRPLYIVAVEALDGVGTAIGGVLGVLVVSDLAQGTGRFNLMNGMVQAAVGVGAFLGNSAGGFIAKSAGFPTAFATLSAVAAAGFVLYAVLMPETKPS